MFNDYYLLRCNWPIMSRVYGWSRDQYARR